MVNSSEKIALAKALQDEAARNRAIALLPEMVAALALIAKRIDKASGSPKFSAAEHDRIVALLAKARG